MKTKPTRRRRRSKRKNPTRRNWRGTDIVVTYKGLDAEKDQAVRAALGKYDTGSGFGFDDGQRDHTATVPDDDFDRVLGELKKIPGIKTKKRVTQWLLCR